MPIHKDKVGTKQTSTITSDYGTIKVEEEKGFAKLKQIISTDESSFIYLNGINYTITFSTKKGQNINYCYGIFMGR